MTIRPGLTNPIVQDGDTIFEYGAVLHRRPTFIVSKENFEEYRLGYRCLNCHHAPQPEPFPEHCVEDYCRFPMRERQLELLEAEDRGETDPWPTLWTPS